MRGPFSVAGHAFSLISLPFVILAASCGNASMPGGAELAPIITSQPNLVPTANAAFVPLTAALSVETTVPTRVELRIDDGSRRREVVAEPDYRRVHDLVPILGLRPNRLHTIEVTVRDERGFATTAAAPLQIHTPPLPANFPPVSVSVSTPASMEPGVTLLSLLSTTSSSFPTIVDEEGEVVWFFDCGSSPIGTLTTMVFPLPGGNLMLMLGDWLLVEIDLLGNVVGGFQATNGQPLLPGAVPVACDTFHHDVVAMPPGSDADFAVLSTELRTYANYPASEVNLSNTVPSAEVVGDEIVEFRRDGTIVRRIRLLDLLDPYRLSYDSLNSTFWLGRYGPSFDWSHGNAITLDAQADAWIVSLRHQDAVVQIGRDGQLHWILGDHGRWNAPWSSYLLHPIGQPFAWQYHQHAPQLQGDGSILLFDNGVARAIPPAPGIPEPGRYSRAVEFVVDPVPRTVQQQWSYGEPPGTSEPSFFSLFVSSAYRQRLTRNVLICDGARTGAGQLSTRIVEITPDDPPQIVFETFLGDPAGTTPTICYRAERLPGLYR